MGPMGCRIGPVSVAICALVLVAATTASAAVRYAGPGGEGVDPCEEPSNPCSIYLAADGEVSGTTVAGGDEILLEPGNYSDIAGDLGPENFVRIAPAVKVIGEDGPMGRPVITLNQPNLGGAFALTNAETTLSNVEIDSAVARSNLELFSGTVMGVIARSTSEVASTIVCTQFSGVIRDSACIAAGSGAAAVGASDIGGGPFTPKLRNVTAIATGTGSAGLSYRFFANTSGTLSAKSVIAQGAGVDVQAGGIGVGASSTINLDHSDYDSTEAMMSGGGAASVTAAGTSSNIEAPPLFAGDQIHQLPGSPTVDAGATDASSGATDIDGQLRTIGSAVDIGADELGDATSTAVACKPTALTVGGATSTSTCTATVTDTSLIPTAPTGIVSFSASGFGHFDSGAECALAPATATQSSCQVGYIPDQVGSGVHEIGAGYPGDNTHEASQGTSTLGVSAAPAGTGGAVKGTGTGRGGSNAASAPDTRLGKKPAKKSKKRVAKFTFSSDGPRATFECKLDRRTFAHCASPFKRRVKPGPHAFRVRAVSSAGTPDPSPAVYRWKVLPTS
jgi:hypothetical protein